MGTESAASGDLPQVARFPKHALAFAISQVSLSLGNGAATFSIAQREILKWMDSRAGRPLPDEAWQGNPFELEEIGAQHVEAVAIGSPRFWAARLDDAVKNVPSRSWVTEVALGQSAAGDVAFGARLTAVVRGPRLPFDRSIPGFVRQVVQATGANLNGRMISSRPWFVMSDVDVSSLVRLIKSQKRLSDVIVISSRDTLPHHIECAVNAYDVVKRTLGVAHVAVINPSASDLLANALGKEFSVSHQSIRVYRPKFDENLDQPFAHPLALAKKIAAWSDGGAAAYTRILVEKALAKSVAHEDAERIVPSFASVKQIAARIRIAEVNKSDHTNDELINLLERDNEDLRRQLERGKSESDALLIIAEQERESAIAAFQQSQENMRHFRRRIAKLEEQIANGVYRSTSIPENIDDAKDWCEQELSGSVVLHSRAYRGLKESIFTDVDLIYRVLLMLRDEYVPMRRLGGDDLTRKFRERCIELGVVEEATGSEARAEEQGEEYFIRYEGRRVYMDRHLKKGTSREARNCFRAYFLG